MTKLPSTTSQNYHANQNQWPTNSTQSLTLYTLHYHTHHYITLTTSQYHNFNFLSAVRVREQHRKYRLGEREKKKGPSFLFLFFSVRKPEREEGDLGFGLSSIRELVQRLRPGFLHPAASQSKGERKRELTVCIFFWTAESENCSC